MDHGGFSKVFSLFTPWYGGVPGGPKALPSHLGYKAFIFFFLYHCHFAEHYLPISLFQKKICLPHFTLKIVE